MAERVVKHALIRWFEKGEDRMGNEVLSRRTAFQGETVDLPAAEEKRLDAFDALHPKGHGEGAGAAAADGAGVPDLDGADVEDVVEWMAEAKPSAPQIVQLADDDVDRAQLLLEAEHARDGDPRKTVVEPLQKIIDEG